jgi:hypothetical protein
MLDLVQITPRRSVMSQLTQPISVREQLRAHWVLALSALLALAATAAVVLVLAIEGGSSETTSAAQQSQPAVRSDGGPDESAVALSVGSRVSPGPSESTIAATVSGSVPARPTGGYWESADPRSSYQPAPAEGTGGPDESSIAASVAQPQAPQQPRPDEAGIAATISGR